MLKADLSRRAEVQRMAASLQTRHIDILVNNAGALIKRTRVLELGEELWDEVMELNLNSAFPDRQVRFAGDVESQARMDRQCLLCRRAQRRRSRIGCVCFAKAPYPP